MNENYLGKKIKDKLTGSFGIVVGHVKYLYAPDRIALVLDERKSDDYTWCNLEQVEFLD